MHPSGACTAWSLACGASILMEASACMCRLKGLSAEDMLVYQHIQASGNTGAQAPNEHYPCVQHDDRLKLIASDYERATVMVLTAYSLKTFV